MKVLIIGITGLAGRHLYNQLIENEMYDIYGTYYKNMENVSQFPDAELFRCDVNDINSRKSNRFDVNSSLFGFTSIAT